MMNSRLAHAARHLLEIADTLEGKRVGFAKLYDRKTPITAADLLNGHVIRL
jgi:hypothetical protein